MNRLPPEVLSRVARCSADEDARDARSIVPLTHVCRYWRESVISAPENWTSISNDKIELANLSLERVRAARLDLSLDMHQFRTDPGSFGLVTLCIKNIATLHVYSLSAWEELSAAVPGFPQSTPNLQSLTLLCAYAKGRWNPAVDPFGSLPPTLKRLSLFNIPLYPSLCNLKALTDLSLRCHRFDLNLDTLLDFLEHNLSLQSAALDIRFAEPSLRTSRRQGPIRNRLQHLSIYCNSAANAQVFVSKIALREGAHLDVSSFDQNTGLNDVLAGIPTTHLSNLPSPDFMDYQSFPRTIHACGPSVGFSFSCSPSLAIPFVEYPLLSLTNVREFRLNHHVPERFRPPPDSLMFRPSSFPSLEALSIEYDADLSEFLSALLSNPSALPSLNTIAFLGCVVTECFMNELTRFTSERKNTTSARLHHVVIIDRYGDFPSATSIRELGRHVPVVDVRFGGHFPTFLKPHVCGSPARPPCCRP